MKLTFLASFIAFIILISVTIKNQTKRAQEIEREFWSREKRANSVRKKPLDNLKYISIPLEKFPTHIMSDNPTISECIDILTTLSSQKIVNLTGYSNTDLKLEYGTANITLLSEYDQNFTILVRTLQKWADVLLENHYDNEAAILMEFAIQSGTDIRRTYYALAEYYVSQKSSIKIDYLIETAKQLNSSNRDNLVRNLQEQYPAIF